MILILSIVLIIVAIINIWNLRRRKGRLQIFDETEVKNASLTSLVESQLSQKRQSSWARAFWDQMIFDTNMMIKSNYNIFVIWQSKARLFVYIFAGMVVGIILNANYTHYDSYTAALVSVIATIVITIVIKKRKLKKEFYDTFPEALNTITGVVSSGGAIITSFRLCGDSIDGIVGKTMKEMDDRIEIGENVEEVLMKSYIKLPFPEYYFFILTVMVNFDSGGELKEIMSRLAKMLTNNRILSKTRDGKTAELRMTMRILACMPFAFMLALKFLSETHYEYLINTTPGHYLLYYVVGSVIIGFLIIKGMISKII